MWQLISLQSVFVLPGDELWLLSRSLRSSVIIYSYWIWELIGLTDASLNAGTKELSISGIMQAFPLLAFLNNIITCQIRPQRDVCCFIKNSGELECSSDGRWRHAIFKKADNVVISYLKCSCLTNTETWSYVDRIMHFQMSNQALLICWTCLLALIAGPQKSSSLRWEPVLFPPLDSFIVVANWYWCYRVSVLLCLVVIRWLDRYIPCSSLEL